MSATMRPRLKPRIRYKAGRWEMDGWFGLIGKGESARLYPRIAISHTEFTEAAEYFKSVIQKEAY
jgi:hypothetical protein